MPRRFPRRRLFLDQYVVVKKLRGRRLHNARSVAGGVAFFDEPSELRDAPPVAVVVKKSARFAADSVLGGMLPGFGHIAFNAVTQTLNPVCEQVHHQHCAISLVRRDNRVVYLHGRDRGT